MAGEMLAGTSHSSSPSYSSLSGGATRAPAETRTEQAISARIVRDSLWNLVVPHLMFGVIHELWETASRHFQPPISKRREAARSVSSYRPPSD